MNKNENINDTSKRFWKGVCYYLSRKRGTWAWLASELGISPSALSQMKSRGSSVGLENAEKISKALKVPVDNLLGNMNEEQRRMIECYNDVPEEKRKTLLAICYAMDMAFAPPETRRPDESDRKRINTWYEERYSQNK